MPFTLSHAAAVLPLRRFRFVPSALVVGTFAPDLEYFVRFAPGGGWGHTVPGAFGMSLPMGLAALALWQCVMKQAMASLMPDAIHLRLVNHLKPFAFGGTKRFFAILLSILTGIATHIVWDAFTHNGSWVYSHSRFLHRRVPNPILPNLQYFELLQHISTIVGLAILAVWLRRWWGRTAEAREFPSARITVGMRLSVWGVVLVIALAGAMARTWMLAGTPEMKTSPLIPIGAIIVTFLALFLWGLVVWSVAWRWIARGRAVREEPARTYSRART